MRIKVFVLFIIFFTATTCFANNLKVQNVSLEKRRVVDSGPNILVEFDISWDNSWRHTENYDAAWIVFKASLAASSTLTHCTVIASTSDYNLGNTVGSNKDLEFSFQSDEAGVFLQRKVSGEGTTSTTNARVTINCGATTSQSIAVSVIGIEMVYIPAGPYYAGDTVSNAGFKKYSSNTDPWFIESEQPITTTSTATGSYYYTSAGNSGEYASGTVFTIPRNFPKGYTAFYCMKYPVTEGQWVEFFNSIGSAAQANRDITAASGKAFDIVIKRNAVSWGGSGSATTSREDRAMSYLSWMDLAAYLDWVALRPMTELEFEKVARGFIWSTAGEYAWGSTVIYSGITFSSSPEDGNERFTSVNLANTVYDSTTFTQGDAILGAQFAQGPVRAGIFAISDSTRERAGAGYYGVMDLSGNLYEHVVTVGNTTGIIFYPDHGDGSLNTLSGFEGNARQLGWVGTTIVGIEGVTGATGTGFRAGSWNSVWTLLRTSDRSEAALASASRDNRYGGRGVRYHGADAVLPECGDLVVTAPEQCDDGMHCSLPPYESCLSGSDCTDVDATCGVRGGDGCSVLCEKEDCDCACLGTC